MTTETSPQQLEAAEDIIASAIAVGVKFGVRCGCPECDTAVKEWILRIRDALNA